LPEIPNLTQTYFVQLELIQNSGVVVSHNFYWLSTQKEKMDWAKSDFTRTPTARYEDSRLKGETPVLELSGWNLQK
jgi:exo-1,4-beta-D-glucosaminidase